MFIFRSENSIIVVILKKNNFFQYNLIHTQEYHECSQFGRLDIRGL